MENTVDETDENDDLFIQLIWFNLFKNNLVMHQIPSTLCLMTWRNPYTQDVRNSQSYQPSRLYNLKVRYGWTNTSFSELLSIISDLLPDNNEIPCSLYEAKKTLGALGLSYQKIDACPNDCCLYRKEYEKMTKCPKCGLSRWNIAKNSKKEKVVWLLSRCGTFQ